MFASLVRKPVSPDFELILHFKSGGPFKQAERIFSCSRSRSTVKYLTRLPRGNTSFALRGTSFRPRISPPSTRHSISSLGFNPTASQMDSGRVIRRFLSRTVAFMEGLSLFGITNTSGVMGPFKIPTLTPPTPSLPAPPSPANQPIFSYAPPKPPAAPSP
jgi:hypothetical protein